MNQKNKKRGGFYWKNEVPYLSVTKIIDVLDKPQLRYWYAQMAYRATILDPTIDEKTACNEPNRVSSLSKDRGSAVHSIVEAYKNISEVVGQDGPYKQYAIAFRTFLDDHDIQILEQEKTLYSHKYMYAGTCDMVAELHDKLVLIDVKTGKDLYPTVHLQLSAYKQLLKEDDIDVEDTYALLLRDDGTYKFEQGRDKFKAFLACLELYKDLNSESLIKFGYMKGEENGNANEETEYSI